MIKNDKLLYINTSSNHPQQIIKQLPISINKRLSKNSSNERIFNESKQNYIEALEKSGYKNINLSFKKLVPPKKRTRKRNVIWFNPPFNKNISTNIAQIFLQLLDKHFPRRNKTMHKLFNRNNVKVSYSCTPNMGRIIKGHNRNLLSKKKAEVTNLCNCRNKLNCPLQGTCQKKSIVYQCEIEAPNTEKKTYIGLTEREFKTRFGEHKTTFNNKKYSNSTTLSSYIWEMKKKGIHNASLKWSFIKEISSYNNTTKRCNLCLYEKYAILNHPSQEDLLNKKSELVSKCRHQNKFLLANYKSKD